MLQICLFGWLCENLEQYTTIPSFLRKIQNWICHFQTQAVWPQLSPRSDRCPRSDRILAVGLTGPGEFWLICSNLLILILSSHFLVPSSQDAYCYPSKLLSTVFPWLLKQLFKWYSLLKVASLNHLVILSSDIILSLQMVFSILISSYSFKWYLLFSFTSGI